MFTGIIESIGTVESLQNDILKIRTVNNKFFNLEFGTSIAIDGCCLTLKDYEQDLLCFQVSDETLSRTSLKDSHCGYVNMELPLTIDSFLSGHLVQGHVDEVINLKTIEKLESELWNFTFSNASNKYLVDKGSITINGISLTVIEPDEDTFTVAIIEETFNRTNLKNLSVDDRVNVEYDIVIKYLEKLNYDN
jgi:riboflavin synthase